ncbi:prolyl endopeptidase-like isoform A [Chlorella sorokiniana]|uniref:Prolyl endopeptidase-like n=1 Tax=Chlorella sorokiniana TaxID=3076 RepID=A0A2P6TKN0_CHLSO|nr:prolyl endopeptidase-like isoform A [Chlorella sorokiniana]|eukprot:PRW44843.1 prolyl endopeptidase-like isoform A [Chlorella sorokiniana]
MRARAVLGATAVALTAVGTGLLFRRLAPASRLNRLLNRNLHLFAPSERTQLQTLASSRSKSHLLRHWPAPGVKDGAKRALVAAAAAGAPSSELEAARLDLLEAPLAAQRPHRLEMHGDVREDPYYWLRDDEREDADVIAHLKAEAAYTKAVLADTEQLQDQLYKEMRGRIQEADQSAPIRFKNFFYYTRTLEGAQYAVHCRRALAPGAPPPSEADAMDESIPEEVLLDENEEAKRYSFYMVAGFEESPDHKLVAWGEDTSGNEKYTLRVRDIATGKDLLTKPIKDTAGNFAWANDCKTLFYVTKDKLDRPYKVWRHVIGTDPSQDECVFHEQDDSFYIGISRSRSERMLYIHAGSAVTSDVRYMSADEPRGEWKLVLPRTHETEYSVEDRGDHLFITIRDQARPNSELLVASISDPTATKVLLPHREDVKLEHVEASQHFLTSFERREGLQCCVVYKLSADDSMPAELGEGELIQFEEPAYELSCGSQGDFDSPVLRMHYTSLRTPDQTVDFNMATRKRAVKKEQPVLGGFDPAKYTTQRLWATAPDGTRVPISLVYRSDLAKLDGSDPLLLDAYGSYEIPNDAHFRSSRLSLLDRGITFAIAHVRGGGEMGRRWYEAGKYLKKKNTFTDFIACAEHLVAHKYTSPQRLCIEGRSAGGLTMGAVVNMRPDLFHAAILGVPFVDCLTTMLDETIPLTVIEWEEWGNPAEKEYYDYMKSYSPVDNVQPAAYPHMLVLAGLHDPRVGYWEPAKFVAKVRQQRTNANLLLLKCDMGAGHFSQSGRFDRLKEVAVEFAFLLKVLGMKDAPLQPSGPAAAAAAAAKHPALLQPLTTGAIGSAASSETSAGRPRAMGGCLTKAEPPRKAADAAAAVPPPPSAVAPGPHAEAVAAAASHCDGPSCVGPSSAAVLEAPWEEERLKAVHALNVLGIEPKPALDNITQLMAAMFQTPVSAVSLVAEELHFISRAGHWACSTGRAGSFCDWILVPEAPEMLIVENAAEDARFRDNPYVKGDPRICFYAGAPLVATRDGHRYGTLCVFDFKPRSFSPAQYAMLSHFAELAVREMERELALEEQRQLRAGPAEMHLTRALDTFHEGVILLDLSSTMWHIVYANTAFREAAHMPTLLLGSSATALDSPVVAAAAAVASSQAYGPVDFWQLFRLVKNGDQGSNNAALLAMATGKEFSIQVQPVASSYSTDVGGYGSNGAASSPRSDGANGNQPPVLTLLFRPTGVEALRHYQPHIGIPAWVRSGSSGDLGSADNSTCSLGSNGGGGPPSPFSALAASPRRRSQEAKPQPYYFGVLQAGSKQPVSPRSAGSSPLLLPTPVATLDKPASLRSVGSPRSKREKALPALRGFVSVRPEVLQEVKLGALIGRGSMGRAYRGVWQGGRVAVKVIDTLRSADGKPRASADWDAPTPQAAVVEALLGRSLTHPHIVTVYAHGVSEEEATRCNRIYQQVWIVQEYCNRGSLLDAIDRGTLHMRAGAGGPNLSAIVACAQEVAGALCYLHSNDVIHGDLTPSNVLLVSAAKDARRFICKVGDFGLATWTGGMPERHSSNFGTVTHMPPELLGEGILSKATDAWSFGVLLLEMWHGKRAWLGVQPISVMSQVSAGQLPFDVPSDAPPALANIMRRCISLDPSARPTFQEILAALYELGSSLQSSTPTEGPASAAGSASHSGMVEHKDEALWLSAEQQADWVAFKKQVSVLWFGAFMAFNGLAWVAPRIMNRKRAIKHPKNQVYVKAAVCAATHAILCLAVSAYVLLRRDLSDCEGRAFCFDDMTARMLTVHAGYALFEVVFWQRSAAVAVPWNEMVFLGSVVTLLMAAAALVYPCRLSVLVLPVQQLLEAATLVDCMRRLCAVYGAPWHIRFKLQLLFTAAHFLKFVGSAGVAGFIYWWIRSNNLWKLDLPEGVSTFNSVYGLIMLSGSVILALVHFKWVQNALHMTNELIGSTKAEQQRQRAAVQALAGGGGGGGGSAKKKAAAGRPHTAGVLCLLLCLCACAEPVRSTKLKVPPIGPHHSHGVRQQGLLLGSDRPLVERCKERWRETRLDHFTWHTQHYWEQRYFTCDEFYQPGGPIFFYLGNEADVTLYLNNTGLMWELAPRHHALLVFAEHRFYGQSKPFKPSKLRKQKHMGYLTTEQAMADYATLIWELKEELKDPDAPVIGFGGSYGGMLATWFRLKYPHLLDGAIAASAPIWTYKGEDPPVDPGAFARIVTQDASPEGGSAEACAQNVRQTWRALQDLGGTEEGRQAISQAMRLCEDSALESEGDVTALRDWAASAWDYMAMGNYPYPSSYIINGAQPPLPAFPVRAACEHLADAELASDALRLLRALRDAVGIFYNHTGDLACFSFKEGPNPETDEDSNFWGYQYCTEQFMPFAKDGVNDMFWKEPFSTKQTEEGCRDQWGVEPRTLWASVEWGGRRLEAASNIVFSNGLLDPWSGGGVLYNISEANDLVAVIIPEGAHHLDLMFSHQLDPPSVREARALEERYIAKWVAQAPMACVTSSAVARPVAAVRLGRVQAQRVAPFTAQLIGGRPAGRAAAPVRRQGGRRSLHIVAVRVENEEVELGTKAPDFELLEPLTGKRLQLHAYAAGAPATLVMFICNHCPFVVHLKPALTELAKEYQAKGVKVVAISSNSVETHPQDGPDKMAEDAKEQGYTFPYLYDETQEVAKAYKAACTPEFYVFDADLKLTYHGQFDDSRPSKYGGDTPVTGEDLRHALDCAIAGKPLERRVKNSIGCNIKWRPGHAPACGCMQAALMVQQSAMEGPKEAPAEPVAPKQPKCEAAAGQGIVPRPQGSGEAAAGVAAACDDGAPLPEPGSPGASALDPPRPTTTYTAASSEGSPPSSAKRERQPSIELQAAAAAAAASPLQAGAEQPGTKRQRSSGVTASTAEERLAEAAARAEAAEQALAAMAARAELAEAAARAEAAEQALAAMAARAELAEGFAARLSSERLSWVAEVQQQQAQQRLKQQVQQLQDEVQQLRDSAEAMAAAAAALELKHAPIPGQAADQAKLQRQLSSALAARDALEQRLVLATEQQVTLSQKLAQAQQELKQQAAELQLMQQQLRQPEQCANCQGWAEALTVKCQELAAAEAARDAALAAAKQATDIAMLGHEEAVQVRAQADKEAADLRQQLQQLESERATVMAAVGLAAQMLAQEEEAQAVADENGQQLDVKLALAAVLQQMVAEHQAAVAQHTAGEHQAAEAHQAGVEQQAAAAAQASRPALSEAVLARMQPWLPPFTQPHELGMDWAKNVDPEGLKSVVEACRDEPESLAVFRPAVLCCYLRSIGEKAPGPRLDVAVQRIKDAWATQALHVQAVRLAQQALQALQDGGGEEA